MCGTCILQTSWLRNVSISAVVAITPGPSSTSSSRFADASATPDAEDDAWEDMDSLMLEGDLWNSKTGMRLVIPHGWGNACSIITCRSTTSIGYTRSLRRRQSRWPLAGDPAGVVT